MSELLPTFQTQVVCFRANEKVGRLQLEDVIENTLLDDLRAAAVRYEVIAVGGNLSEQEMMQKILSMCDSNHRVAPGDIFVIFTRLEKLGGHESHLATFGGQMLQLIFGGEEEVKVPSNTSEVGALVGADPGDEQPRH